MAINRENVFLCRNVNSFQCYTKDLSMVMPIPSFPGVCGRREPLGSTVCACILSTRNVGAPIISTTYTRHKCTVKQIETQPCSPPSHWKLADRCEANVSHETTGGGLAEATKATCKQERIESAKPAREHVTSINGKIQTWRMLTIILLYIATTKYGGVPCGHLQVTVSLTICVGSLETKLTTDTKPLQQACQSEMEDKPWNGLSKSLSMTSIELCISLHIWQLLFIVSVRHV